MGKEGHPAKPTRGWPLEADTGEATTEVCGRRNKSCGL